VAPASVDALRQAVIAALLELRDPQTGAPVARQAWLREELYSGAHVQDAPDIVFSLAPGYEPTSELSTQGIFSDASSEGAGIHQPDGVFMALGPSIARASALPVTQMEDVLPTMLYALGLPVPVSLEGEVAWPAIDAATQAARAVAYDAEPLVAAGVAGAPDYTAEEAGQLTARLAALGYLK
jgi:predicted AlkP superfamily phosphohydrolase/phosphomutase